MSIRILLTLISVFLSVNLSLAQENQSSIRTGEFSLTGTSRAILGDEIATAYSKVIDGDKEIEWNIFVPEDYDPAAPAGVIIYYSNIYPNQIQSSWKTGAREKNLIWISLDGGRNFTERRKIFIGVLALSLLQEQYSLNAARIYTTGDRSGCPTSSSLAKIYPNMITGAIYNSCEPVTWRRSTKPDGLDLMKNHHYVFINSNRNENRTDIRRAMNKYNNEGIENTLLRTIGTMEEDVKLNPAQVRTFIDFLDGVSVEE